MSDERVLDLWIPGIPATFATRGELPWRTALAAAIPPGPDQLQVGGLEIEFGLVGARSGAHAADLDNLLEPLFSVLVNAKGWFSGRRPNIRWFSAKKFYGRESGCHITLGSAPTGAGPSVGPPPIFAATYTGPLPRSARDAMFAAWVTRQRAPAGGKSWYSVALRFADLSTNLGDISTGKLKSTLDCLWPVLGGSPGAPEDWRVTSLCAEKGAGSVPPASVQVSIFPGEADGAPLTKS